MIDGDNPRGWIGQAEKCFTLAKTPEYKKVKFAKVFFSRKIDHWLRSTGINTNSLSWSEFSTLIIGRFAAETSLELIDSFWHMEQSSNVNAYIDIFEELMGKLKVHNTTLLDEYFVGCFISGLKEDIKIPLRSHNPTTLVQAYALASNYEAYQPKRQTLNTPRSAYRYTYQPKQNSAPVKNEDDEPK
jgi:hypothetical protein